MTNKKSPYSYGTCKNSKELPYSNQQMKERRQVSDVENFQTQTTTSGTPLTVFEVIQDTAVQIPVKSRILAIIGKVSATDPRMRYQRKSYHSTPEDLPAKMK